MRRKTIVVWTVLLLPIVGGITYSALKGTPPTAVVLAKAERVPRLRSIVSATGEIRAKEFVNIQAEVPGVIVELRVREGDTVKKDDVLLRLDDLQLRADEDAAKAQVGAAEADAKNAEVGVATAEAMLASEHTALANLRVELEQARTTRDRSQASYLRKKALFEGDLVGKEEFEIAAADARITQQRVEWNEARITQGEANLHAVASRVEAAVALKDGNCRRIDAARAAQARATDLLGKTVLRSPLNGLITKLNVEKGERAVPGIQSNPIATLMTIADMSVIEAEVKVSESDIVNVALGATADVIVDAMREVKLAGTVTEMGQSPIQPSNTGANASTNQNQEGKDFKVVVRLTSPPETLRTGFTAQVEILAAVRENCLIIPWMAKTARDCEVDDNDQYVPSQEPPREGAAVVDAAQRRRKKELDGVLLMVDGRVRFRPAQFGIAGDQDVEVLGGLAESDQVIKGPYQALRTLKEWDRVQVDQKLQAAGDLERQFRKRR
jgi:HlyD family secretion protein